LFKFTTFALSALTLQLSLFATPQELFNSVQNEMTLENGIRQHIVNFSNNTLTHSTQELALNLFEDITLIAVQDSVKIKGDNHFTWFGHIKEKQNSMVTLLVKNDKIVGDIQVDGKTYTIKTI
jgi:hypothetical protein